MRTGLSARRWTALSALAAGGVLAILLAIPPASGPAFATPNETSREQQCFDAVQGKVAWDRAGNTGWSPQNVKSLCSGVDDYQSRISCFQRGISKHGQWTEALEVCRKVGAATLAPTPTPTPVNPMPAPNQSVRTFPSNTPQSTPLPAAASQRGRRVQLLTLVVEKRTEFSWDEVYIVAMDLVRTQAHRIPAVQKDQILRYEAPGVADERRGDAYYSVTMDETEDWGRRWDICKSVQLSGMDVVGLYEKDDRFSKPDGPGDDKIGSLVIPADKPAGVYSAPLVGDGGTYNIIYRVLDPKASAAEDREESPCIPSAPRDPDWDFPNLPRQEIKAKLYSPCEDQCLIYTDRRIYYCEMAPSARGRGPDLPCTITALEFLSCVGVCEQKRKKP